MSKRYLVRLTEGERAALGQRVTAGTDPARALSHARLLLKADSGPRGAAWTDERVAAALDVGLSTVARVRRRFVEYGLEAALRRHGPCVGRARPTSPSGGQRDGGTRETGVPLRPRRRPADARARVGRAGAGRG